MGSLKYVFLTTNRRSFFFLTLLLLALAVGCREADQRPVEARIGAPGFFHVIKQDGAWWFVNPSGEKMVSLGINHIEPALICSSNNKDIFIRKYGNDLFDSTGRPNENGLAARRWMDDSIRLIMKWGFNSLGVHNPIPQNQMPYVVKYRPFKLDGWVLLKKEYVDPFDPRTEMYLEQYAHDWSRQHEDDRRLLGISFNDMPQWRTNLNDIPEWVMFIMRLPAGAPGKQRWVEQLKSSYRECAAAEKVYGIGARSWDEFLSNTEWPTAALPELAARDAHDFLPLIADNWYRLMTATIRKYDSRHLIFGDKLEGRTDMPPWLDPILKKYVDVIYIQWYAMAADQLPRLFELYEHTGKPILLGDSTFSCPNQNVPRPKGVHFASQEEVGQAYYHYLKKMIGEPFIVGWHNCGFIEGSPDLRRYHPFFAIQPGFLRPDGTPYEETIKLVEEANRRALNWHADARKGSAGDLDYLLNNQSDKNLQNSRAGHDFLADDSPRRKTMLLNNMLISRIDANVYVAGRSGSGIRSPLTKNLSWVVTDEGVVVIDTGKSDEGKALKQLIRRSTDQPIKYIIYTHHHGTQIGGARYIMEPGTRIIAHENLVLEFNMKRELANHISRLNSIQFDLEPLPETESEDLIYPNLTYQSTYSFTLGGKKFELYHADSEARDYTMVHLPGQKIIWLADMIAVSAPMVASPMKPVRDEVKWKLALQFVKTLHPEVLLASGPPPICSPLLVDFMLDSHIEYLDFLHRAVMREVDRGSNMEQALHNIVLPERLLQNPLVRDSYGCLEFSIRGLFQKYSGWFDQNGAHLKPVPAKERAVLFINDMGGGEKVLARAAALADNLEDQVALEYLDLLIDADDHAAEAHELKCHVLREMSGHYSHWITSNMFSRLSKMEHERAVRKGR